MKKRIDCIAFHEEGHAYVHILTEHPFKYVTIQEDKEKDEHGLRSLGHVMYENPKASEERDQYSILNPNKFDLFFKDNFTSVVGFVAETIYRGRSNVKSSKEDFRQVVHTSLQNLSEQLSSKYISFLLAYALEVLHKDENWTNNTALTLALIDEETLSYASPL